MNDASDLLRRLAGRRLLARLAILFEFAWPALWPPLAVAGVFLLLALLDLPRFLPPWGHLLLLGVTAGAIVLLLVRGFWRIRPPGNAQADRRLELASGLAHRPLSVLTDRPAFPDQPGDGAEAALWRAHAERALRQVRRLRVGLPRPGLARRDPRAFRVGLIVALIAALFIAGPDAPARLAAAMQPSLPASPGAPATETQAWITPPAYTRMAPVFLKPEGGAVSMPAGSHFTANVTGAGGSPSLLLNGHASAFTPLDAGSFQADRELTEGGRLSVRVNGHEIAAWDLTVLADQPPRVAWAEPPGRAASSQQVRLPWQVSDDYGVTGLRAELHLSARPSAAPVVISIPLPGGGMKTGRGASQQDLTANPWAGLPVTARLIGRDALNQEGASDPAEFELPERPFHNPVARALIAVRKTLSLHPDQREDALAGLDQLIQAPQMFGHDAAAVVNLGAIYYLLLLERAPDAVPEAQDRLWQLALHMEEGQTERTARNLDEARQAAREALEKSLQDPSQANRQALDQRLKELQEAIQKHMQALLEEAQRNHQITPADPDARQLSNKDLDRKAEQAREAAREGKMNEAQQQMAELERMLDQLRNARPEQGQNGQQNAQRQKGRQQMGALQDMIGRQGGLLDRSQARGDQPPQRMPGNMPGSAPPTAPADAAQQREADRRVQQALRSALGELMQQFGDMTGQVPPSLGEADQAMREAGKSLAEGRDGAAGDAERRAIEALQKGGREMGQAMARQSGSQPGSGQPGDDGQDGDQDGGMGMSMQDGRGDDRGGPGPLPGSPGQADSRGRDPLGRRYNQGSAQAGDVTVPEERERQRTQAIEEELRRRGGERSRPQQELDYIDRLLKQF